jgi:DNA-binding NtrC family response regulator
MANVTGNAKSSYKILYGEGETEVVAAQAVSIQKAGHQVSTAVGRKAVEEAMGREKFDWLVLGPTLSRNDRHHLPYKAKKANPTVQVMVMHTDGERHPAVDANVDTGRSMDDVLAKIAAASKSESSQGMARKAAAGK